MATNTIRPWFPMLHQAPPPRMWMNILFIWHTCLMTVHAHRMATCYRWQKLLTRKNCSRTNIYVVVASSDNMPTMASADYHSGIPSLSAMPSPGRNDNQWSWMIVVCLGASWVAPRRPWDDGGCHGWSVRVLAFFGSVLCDVLHGQHCRRHRK